MTGEAADVPAGGTHHLSPWRSDGTADVVATGRDPQAVVLAGLRAVLSAARGQTGAAPPPEEQASAAAPIRGQGADLGALFAELAADLLAQLDAHGLGFAQVRLDGLLRTDDGGYTAWGYALGTPVAAPPPVGLSLDGDPSLDERPEGLTLRFTLRREAQGEEG